MLGRATNRRLRISLPGFRHGPRVTHDACRRRPRLPVAVILSWFYQVSASGISRTPPFIERRTLNNIAPLDDRRREAPLRGDPARDEAAYDWVLEIESGPLSGQRYGIESTVVVGRSRECDLTVPAARISRQHVRFIVEGKQLLIEDLGSSNDDMECYTCHTLGEHVAGGPVGLQHADDGAAAGGMVYPTNPDT